jgi:hypothetical protein
MVNMDFPKSAFNLDKSRALVHANIRKGVEQEQRQREVPLGRVLKNYWVGTMYPLIGLELYKIPTGRTHLFIKIAIPVVVDGAPCSSQ